MLKRQLGQFFTTHADYILQGFESYIKDKQVTDPFAGNGDLLLWAKKHKAKSIKGYDIDKLKLNNNIIYYNDSIKNPRDYEFVLTNPPYLYQNKLSDNAILRHSKHTDLFQISLEKILDSNEGIVIVPINFLSADNSKYIRNSFFSKFEIENINYFTIKVFKDTTYNVISFYYKLRKDNKDFLYLNLNIYPENKTLSFKIYKQYNWKIGGEFIDKIKKTPKVLKIKRLKDKDIINGDHKIVLAFNHLSDKRLFNIDQATHTIIKNNIILLKAIDTGAENGKICLKRIKDYDVSGLVSKSTSRNQIQIIFDKELSFDDQELIIKEFNQILNTKRDEYFSLFMTNFRDKNRKRVSFNFAYNLINHVYYEYIGEKLYATNKLPLFG